MTTRRTEPFRYSMVTPLLCWIEIREINEVAVNSKLAEVELIDISKSGCRIQTRLDLRASTHQIAATVHVRLNEDLHKFPGSIRWQKEHENAVFHYGLSLELTDEMKECLNIELRSLAAARRIVVL
ncbi:PilZ domain-containing protein [Paenibacillus fonticola]|uniref:PilZ domain-containing protein n=1 Tax=Paenibacillus fonticola TaxID=379896 RepID=UPI00037BC73A|nr:PilZ domain-containing protein [Paenibacillus fonticola]